MVKLHLWPWPAPPPTPPDPPIPPGIAITESGKPWPPKPEERPR